MEYFADIGASGPIRHDQAAHAVDILSSLDLPESIGVAIQMGSLGDGMALWRLKIDGIQIPGLWFIIDRRFVPADGPSA